MHGAVMCVKEQTRLYKLIIISRMRTVRSVCKSSIIGLYNILHSHELQFHFAGSLLVQLASLADVLSATAGDAVACCRGQLNLCGSAKGLQRQKAAPERGRSC